MFHGFDYPDEVEKDKFYARFWRPKMVDGMIEFIRPDDESLVRKFVRPMKANPPATIGLEEEGLLEGYEERSAWDELDSEAVRNIWEMGLQCILSIS